MYQMQIKIAKRENVTASNPKGMTFVSIAMTNQPPYEYETREEAGRMLNMCYPEAMRDERRIIEV